MTRRYEIRCPIHGFINLTEWEWDIINHEVFQRLRRIRQLAWTDMVYPAAMHTRFEHSLGVMATATRMFDEIWYRQGDVLRALNFTESAKDRHRTIVRLAALLHDVGHSPFSHAGEGLMPTNPTTKKPYKHVQYSAAIIRELMADVIEDHDHNRRNHEITVAQIADFLEGKTAIGHGLHFWRQLVDSQLDADRADYLLRDSYHVGVKYGQYDLHRLLVSLVVGIHPETEDAVLAVSNGGWHTAEALILARYLMFTQVYFHKTRSIYDYHFGETMKVLLAKHQDNADHAANSTFPPPTTNKNLRGYLAWTDWRVLGLLQEGQGDVHGEIIRTRNHHRVVFQTGDFATQSNLEEVDALKEKLESKGIQVYIDDAQNSWYKEGVTEEILVTTVSDHRHNKKTEPLSVRSRIVEELQRTPLTRQRVYVPISKREKALKIVEAFKKEMSRKGAA